MTTDPRIAFFDHHAPSWDTDGPPHAQILARLETLRDKLGFAPGDHILEVGCGTGQVTGWLAGIVGPGCVTALDFSPAMLARAQARGVPAEFICRDVCADDLGTAAFDAVFCMHCFPHFRDQPAALANFARALKPGGRLIILHLDNWRKINEFHDHVGGAVAGDHLPDPETLTALLREVAMDVTSLMDREDLLFIAASPRP